MPNRVNILQRKTSELSAAGSEPDSVLDYYKGQPESRAISGNASQTAVFGEKKKGVLGAPWMEAEKEDSNWIHRDKLAQIESRELEEAGFRVGRTSRSGSRSASVSRVSRERSNSERHDDAVHGEDRPNNHIEKRQRMVSPIPAEDEEVDDGPAHWDIRTPEEIAAEQERDSQAPRHHALRPSTSRIPIAKTSPVPVPHTLAERDSVLPRSRKGSGAWNGDAIAVNGARARSGSVSSQVLLDESEEVGNQTPTRPSSSSTASPSGSPPKAKVPGKTNPTSGARKPNTNRIASQAKPRNTSAVSPVKRPGTSSGASRPATSHNRPEGEAPWIATMYKPDPRLPPDEQIIPTHAKRMQQDKWETEGRTGSMYDREFRLLNTEELNKPETESKDVEPSEKKEEYAEQWPLASPTKNDIANGRPGTSGGEQGGYKLTPTIPSPQLPSQRNSGTRPTVTPKPTDSIRVQESPETTEKKSCGCCIVM